MYLKDITKEIKYCLYCNGCLRQVDSSTKFECMDCYETINFESFIGQKVTIVSCNNLFVCGDNDISNTYQIYTTDAMSTVIMPVFDINFSDKDRLYNKLRTYILIS